MKDCIVKSMPLEQCTSLLKTRDKALADDLNGLFFSGKPHKLLGHIMSCEEEVGVSTTLWRFTFIKDSE